MLGEPSRSETYRILPSSAPTGPAGGPPGDPPGPDGDEKRSGAEVNVGKGVADGITVAVIVGGILVALGVNVTSGPGVSVNGRAAPCVDTDDVKATAT